MPKRSSSARTSRTLWRLTLLVYAYALVRWLMPAFKLHSMDYLFRLPDVFGVSGYTVNILLGAMGIVGMGLLIFPAEDRILPLICGVLLFLAPVWHQVGATKSIEGFHAFTSFQTNPLVLAFEAGAALWTLIPVQGSTGREWVKPLLGAALIAGNWYLCRMSKPPINWETLLSILCLSLITGFVLDITRNGWFLGAFLPAVFALALPVLTTLGLDVRTALAIVGGGALLAAVFLAASPAHRSAGGITALVGLAAAAGSVLYFVR